MALRTTLTLFILFGLSLSAVDLDTKLLSKSHYIDKVTVNGSVAYVRYLRNKSSDEKIIYKDLDHAYFKPKWNFYTQPNKSDIIAVSELAPTDRYFNGALYNTLELEGECHDCTIALADKRLFEKKDNYIIGAFQKSIDLDALRTNIDLRHLKYLVVLAKSASDIKLTSLHFLNHFDTKKLQHQKPAVWVWRAQDIDLDKLRRHHIKRVYLQVGKGFEAAAKRLYKNGYEVFGLDGDPHHIFNPEALYKSLERVIRLNHDRPIVSGFQIDVEPHVLKSFDINKALYIDQFVSLVKKLHTLSNDKGLCFSVVTPFWYDALEFHKRALIYTIIDNSDEIVLMSYRSHPQEVLNISSDELSYGSYRHKVVYIGVELMPIVDEQHELFILDKTVPCIVEKHMNDRCITLLPQQKYRIKGSNLSFHDAPQRLEDLLSREIQYPAFGGFVFHHLKGLH